MIISLINGDKNSNLIEHVHLIGNVRAPLS